MGERWRYWPKGDAIIKYLDEKRSLIMMINLRRDWREEREQAIQTSAGRALKAVYLWQYVAEPWTMWGPGVPILSAAENPHITYSQSSILVAPCKRFLCICSSSLSVVQHPRSQPKTMHCSIYYWKQFVYNWPVQLKSVLSKVQVYCVCVRHSVCPCKRESVCLQKRIYKPFMRKDENSVSVGKSTW